MGVLDQIDSPATPPPKPGEAPDLPPSRRDEDDDVDVPPVPPTEPQPVPVQDPPPGEKRDAPYIVSQPARLK